MTLFRMEVKQNCEIFLKVDERYAPSGIFPPMEGISASEC
ncbi:hypothetical protein vBPaeMP1420_3 [Pseudomonas phage vB_PaeM_P1420]|nr:hypothetical protein vBPaeMP1420_3 [Pseudomonas phage vB_PaeM_P1420]